MSATKLPVIAPLIAGQGLSQAGLSRTLRGNVAIFRAELIGRVVSMPSPAPGL